MTGPEHCDKPEEPTAEDGYALSRAAIRHPSHAATRAHFLHHPLPRQRRQDGEAA